VEELDSEAEDWMDGLEKKYREALRVLLAEGEVSRDHLGRIAKEHHLLPTDLVDSINSWADESLGDFLIEDNGESFTLYRDLVPTDE
jgi:hypothetical protein